MFRLSTLKWRTKKDYPSADDIYYYSILAVEKKFIIFGGRSHRKVLPNKDINSYETFWKCHSLVTVVNSNNLHSLIWLIPHNRPNQKALSTIARFDPLKNKWTELGYLRSARDGHGVIQIDNEFIVVGGFSVLPTESCILNEQSIPPMTCTTRKPKLSRFAFYPELMLMP